MNFKRILSVVLAVAMALSLVTIAFAERESEADCPYVYVHGFMAKDLLADKNNRDSDVLWPPAGDDILGIVKECLPDLISFVATKDYDALSDAIIGPIGDLLCKSNLDSDGNPVGDSGVYFVYPERDKITKTSQVDFNYDWRLDPIAVAAELNDFIEYVCDASGCDQVVLECHSFGGVITETYSALYGWDRIRSVCYNTTAIFGESYTGELLSGQIAVDADALTEYLKCLLGENEYHELLDGIFDILNDAGITDDICNFANELIENIGERAIREVAAPMFGGWLSIWAMIEDETLDDALDYVFNQVYKDGGSEHKGLVEKINNYNTVIRPYRTRTLVEQNKDVNLYVFTRYNFTSIPLVPSWASMSDTVVDSKNSAFGATFADYGSEFSDSFMAANADNEYVNPDGTVDASTALFPEQTWFVRDLQHAASPNAMEDMAYDLLYYDGQADVNTFEKYPRFIHYDYETGAFNPDTGTTEEKTVFDKIFDFFRRILAFNRKIFEFIFKR